MKITTKTLDEALLFLKDESVFGSEDYSRKNRSDLEANLIVRALSKLEKDGFAYSEKTVKDNNSSTRYFISFDGLLALENAPLFWKNQPYEYLNAKEKFHVIWSLIKVLAIILNGLIVLVFTYLTYIKS